MKKYLPPAVLAVASAISHFIFFGYPAQVVFDEVHNLNFLANYARGTYFFDVHPPLAKLLTFGFGQLFGTTFDIDASLIGNALPPSVILLRLVPLIAGFLLPLVIYALCRNFRMSQATAFLAGLLVILDNSLLVQSSFIMFDSLLLLCGFAALMCYGLYAGGGHKAYLVAAAVLAAGAFSIKWTGASFVLLICIFEFSRHYRTLTHPQRLFQAVRASVPAIALCAATTLVIYSALFAIHFRLLSYSGDGDVFMSPEFQKTLIFNQYNDDASLLNPGFTDKFIELNYKMLDANVYRMPSHPYSSAWYTWPIMQRPIYYWQDQYSEGVGVRESLKRRIYLIGNPAVYWLGIVSVLLIILHSIFRRRSPSVADQDGVISLGTFIALGFLVNFLPFTMIGRIMFLYHYQAALVFSIMAIAYIVDKFFLGRSRLVVTGAIAVVVLVSFLYFSPLTYGTSMSIKSHEGRAWFESWI